MKKSKGHLKHLYLAISLMMLGSLLTSTTAQATTPAVSLPANFNATTSFATVSGVSLSNYTDVQATISVNSGNVKITTTTSLSVPSGYSSSDWTSGSARVISFSGTQSAVNNALATLQYKAPSVGLSDTITVTSFTAGAAYNSDNGRFYEIVNVGSAISWESARCKAKYGDSSTYSGTTESSGVASNSYVANDRCTNTGTRRTLGGLNGYLANITSLSEHEFLKSKLTSTGWIGGADTDLEGTWRWMDGPESGQVFWVESNGSLVRRTTNTISGISQFNYWSDGEPNNSSNEDFAEFGFGNAGVGSSWNDCRNQCGSRTRYVVEYGGDGGTLSGASGTISVRTAPDAPTSLSATGGIRSADLSWTAPSQNGGTAITGYQVEYRAGSGSWLVATSNTGNTSTTYTVTGLNAGTSYTFRVAAINAAGTGTTSTVSSAVTPTKATPTFASWGNVNKTYGNSEYTVTAPTVIDSIPGTFTYTSSDLTVITISGTNFTIVGAGSSTITASFTPTDTTNYNSASTTNVVTVAKSSQTITFVAPSTKSFGDAAFSLPSTDTSTSGLAIDFASITPEVCSITGITITVLAAGTCTITADQPGGDNFFAAPQVTRSFTVTKAQPLLSSFSLPTKTFGDTPFTLTAPTVTGSIPGSFSYLSDSASVATVSGNSVTITGAGSATLTALFTPTDTENYETATITALLTVSQASQSSLTITSTSTPYGQSLSLTTSGGSGTGALTFVVNSGNCSISSSTLTSTSTGSCSVTATKASDSNYLAESTTATITITTGIATATIAFSSTTLTFGVLNPITVTVSTAGSVRFFANGRVIKNCKSISTITSGTITATCNYRPATRRPLTIRARLTPTDLNIAERVSTSAQFLVQRRTGVRG